MLRLLLTVKKVTTARQLSSDIGLPTAQKNQREWPCRLDCTFSSCAKTASNTWPGQSRVITPKAGVSSAFVRVCCPDTSTFSQTCSKTTTSGLNATTIAASEEFGARSNMGRTPFSMDSQKTSWSCPLHRPESDRKPRLHLNRQKSQKPPSPSPPPVK